MMITAWRGLATAGIGAALLLGPIGCSMTSTVDRNEVASTVGSAMREQGVPAEGATCPDDLVAEVGRVLRCEFTSGGQPVDAVVTVTSVSDGKAHYDIHTEARPIARALLDDKVGQLIGEQAGVAIDSTSCSGDLPPQVGRSVDCTVSAAGETAGFTVTVTSVDGGQVNFSVAQA
jgi:hypothetical protein